MKKYYLINWDEKIITDFDSTGMLIEQMEKDIINGNDSGEFSIICGEEIFFKVNQVIEIVEKEQNGQAEKTD